ncbi:hypothetical protein BCR33DRAFT_796540 [Rhizoclosmatium globosum]|uniref:HCP-like protein n=1 Tax=Rhizoclosmatium globosum TaxID=329046 RepID=A0A1Y2AM09_9FUNG|nr:hypothetical protein BCR33DRAFT_796540 [Rhizoclosmatium globosum]|eukprot:ORY23330.1 hypothetical protein BCR33DRAFT_796540 [Rhizoclosmatium globosum]
MHKSPLTAPTDSNDPFSDESAIELNIMEESTDESLQAQFDSKEDVKSIVAITIKAPDLNSNLNSIDEISSGAYKKQLRPNILGSQSSIASNASNASNRSNYGPRAQSILKAAQKEKHLPRANTGNMEKRPSSPKTDRRVSLLPMVQNTCFLNTLNITSTAHKDSTKDSTPSSSLSPSRMLSPASSHYASSFLGPLHATRTTSTFQKHHSIKLPATFSELSDAHYAAIQRALESNDLDIYDLVGRLNSVRDNAIWAAENPHNKNLKHLDHKRADISIIPIASVTVVKKQGLKKLVAAIKRLLDTEHIETLQERAASAVELPTDHLPPPLPPNLAHEDALSIAIHYHETGQLPLSAFYLKKASAVLPDESINPLALYLLALSRRHGWGLVEDKHKAFLELVLCAEKTILMVPALLNQRLCVENDSVSIFSGGMGSLAPKSIFDAFSMFSNISGREIQLDDAMNILPLPLFEIAVSLFQGWGVPKSRPAAMFFYRAAAILGDVDAMYELGCLNLKLGLKAEAAFWLREAVNGGRRLTGETWIFKKKWGGDQP